MKKDSYVIVGYSGHAYVVCDILLMNDIEIIGYCDKTENTKNPYRLAFLGHETEVNLYNHKVFISIGDNSIRKSIFDSLNENVAFGGVYHQSAEISRLSNIGSMVMIGANVVINALSTVNDGVIINTGSIIEHECNIGSFSHIAPGAVLAGNVKIGTRTFIGANCVIKQGITIGDDVIVGAGAVIINDVPDGATVVGNPGRILKNK